MLLMSACVFNFKSQRYGQFFYESEFIEISDPLYNGLTSKESCRFHLCTL